MLEKIIRATGLLLIILGLLLDRHAYFDLNLNARAAFVFKTLGSGAGSLYHVCGKDHLNIDKIVSDFDEKKASNLKYYFYDIANPKDYLTGKDAIAVEKGPYLIKKHSIKYNVGFKTSALTDAGEPNANGAIEYDVAHAFVPLDKNTDVTTTMSRALDLSLSWDDSQKKPVTSYDKSIPAHLSMSDRITNLSPAYLSVLGEVNDEISLVLAMTCTPAQITNIHDAFAKKQCNSTQRNDMAQNSCACCMLQDEYIARGSPNGFSSCNEYLDDEGAVLSTLSLLAYLDGGVAVREKGDDKFHGSGTFNQTIFKQDKLYTPLLQSHSVNDLLFGYPSAYIGKVLPNVFFAEGDKIMKDSGITNPTKQLTIEEILKGNMDDMLPFKLGNLAAYTKDVGAVCKDTCTSVASDNELIDSPLGHTCIGNAASRHTLSVTDEIILGGVDCKPYSSTYFTKHACNSIDLALAQNATDPKYEQCKCADGSDDYKTTGCCLSAGKFINIDLTASGCLYPIAGETGPNYVGKDAGVAASGKPTVDVGKAIKSWSSNQPSAKNTQFMCPAEGANLPEHKSFARFEEIAGSSTHDTYIHTGIARIRQGDASHVEAQVHSAKVNGANTEYFPATGNTAYFSVLGISYGHTFKGKVPIYIPEMKTPVMFEEDWGLTAIVCDKDELCHKLARLLVAPDAFTATATSELEGVGMPYDGVRSIGHNKGPSKNGRPTYIHQPYYYNGNDELLTQLNNTHVEKVENGNGIKIYRPKTYDSDPGTFTAGESNESYELVDKTLLLSKADDIQSYVDLEPATGLGVRSKRRFGISHSVWECDPSTNANCKHARKIDNSGECYGTAGVELYNNLDTSIKAALDSRYNITNGLTYPCSAANIMTPDVVGGKIIPMYWYEDARTEVGNEEVEVVSRLAKEHYAIFEKFHWTFMIGWIMTMTYGIGMLLRCFCFAPPREFLKSGAIDSKASNAAQSVVASTSSLIAATSSVE